MSSEVSIKTLEVTIDFDAVTHQFTYSGDIDSQNRIVIDVEEAWVSLILKTTGAGSSAQAEFREPVPIVWQGGAIPSYLSLWRPQATGPVTQLLIGDHNPIPPGQPGIATADFAILVEFEGHVYHSPDPSIVNVDPPLPILRPAPRAKAPAATTRRGPRTTAAGTMPAPLHP